MLGGNILFPRSLDVFGAARAKRMKKEIERRRRKEYNRSWSDLLVPFIFFLSSSASSLSQLLNLVSTTKGEITFLSSLSSSYSILS